MAAALNPTATSSLLSGADFNAQHAAHRLLRANTSPHAPQTFRGYASPNKAGAKDALFGEATALGIPHTDRRVALVCQWIDMNSGVALDACGADQ